MKQKSQIDEYRKKIHKTITFCRAYAVFCITDRHLPVSTFMKLKRLKTMYGFGYYPAMNLNLLEKPVNYYNMTEYIDRSLRLSSKSVRELFNDKTVLFKRCPEFLGRDILILEEAEKEDIIAFMQKNPRFVGKLNHGNFGEKFSVYDVDPEKYEETIPLFAKNKQELLEGYIYQHEELAKIYPGSVNTLRIHTVNNGNEIRSYLLPKLRIGCDGSTLDANGDASYRAIVNYDGTLQMPVYINKNNKVLKAERHHNTGVIFSEIRIPFVKEAVELAKTAASYFPEAKFTGWDIAITEKGPVIVEGNGISGCFATYQTINYIYNGQGLGKEIDEMFSFAEGKTKSCIK